MVFIEGYKTEWYRYAREGPMSYCLGPVRSIKTWVFQNLKKSKRFTVILLKGEFLLF